MALNIRKKRVKFRCWHRGSREADLLLGTFAARYLEDMCSADVVKLENIIDCDDVHFYINDTDHCSLM